MGNGMKAAKQKPTPPKREAILAAAMQLF